MILIVEDDPGSQKLLGDVLKYDGHDVMLANSAEEAIALTGSTRPDLFVLDIRLPAMNGKDLLNYFRRQNEFSKTPAIAVTACATAENEEEFLQDGFNECFPKPINIRGLLQSTRRLLGRV